MILRLLLLLGTFLVVGLVTGCSSKTKRFELRPLEFSQAEAICYGPHRDGQRPGGESPTEEQIREDLHIMAEHWKMLRVYGASEFAGEMLKIIREDGLDLQVVLGAWIGVEERRDDTGEVTERDEATAKDNAREVAAAIRLANEYPEIVCAVSVGNETQVFWSHFRGPLDVTVRYVRQVRAAVTQPVTSADDWKYWILPESRELAQELDFVFVHIHPLWNTQTLENGLDWMAQKLEEMQTLHSDRPVIIAETGWATSYLDEGEQGELIIGAVGEAEQKIFYEQLKAWMATTNELTFIFEAFDEAWKGGSHPEEVEKHWGLFRSDRTPKPAMIE